MKTFIIIGSLFYQLNVFYTAIVLMLTGCFFSCAEKGNESGDVPYKPCLCEEEKPVWESFRGEAYLFKDFMPEQMDYQIRIELSESSREVCWIVFDSKTSSAELTIGHGVMSSIGEICNFPDFVREWNIPKNGCKVDFEGVAYESCVFKGGIATVSYFDFILTSLKRK